MTLRSTINAVLQQEGVNFLLTNRMPRRSVTRWFGWFSRIEQPFVRDLSLYLWRRFSDLDLSDAADGPFASLHHCFIRRLVPGARRADPDEGVLASPCDAIVGACGTIRGGEMLQVKGSSYRLAELLRDEALAERQAGGCYATLRLTSTMYHRFHAPHDGVVTAVSHIFGDAWNVNGPALRRVPGLYCRNERAVIRMVLSGSGHAITLVPVAAILVAGIRLGFLDMPAGAARRKPWRAACNAALRKGEEMGWFEHGSTIIMIAPAGFALCDEVVAGGMIRAGQALMRVPEAQASDSVNSGSDAVCW